MLRCEFQIRSNKFLRKAVNWCVCIFLLTGIAGSTSLGAGEIRLLPHIRQVPGGAKPKEVRHVFAGEAHEIRGLVSGDLGKVVLDLHRIAGTTAVPLGEQPVPKAAGPSSSEVAVRVGVPKSDLPVDYLARLWGEEGSRRSLLASVWIRALPRAYLPGMEGRSILAVGFEGEAADGAWAAEFKGGGATIEWVAELPKGPLEADWIFVRRAAAAAALSPVDLRPGQMLVYFDTAEAAVPAGAVDRIVESPGKGRVVTVPLEILSGFRDEAASRARLLRLFSDFP